MWLLLGFMGAAYFLIPEEAEREIHAPHLAYVPVLILVLGTRSARWSPISSTCSHGNPVLGQQGREFLEQPLWVQVGIVVAALVFLYNVSMTVLAGRKTAVTQRPPDRPLGPGRCCSCSPSTCRPI